MSELPCPHLDWGYDDGGEAFCHDCETVVPIAHVQGVCLKICSRRFCIRRCCSSVPGHEAIDQAAHHVCMRHFDELADAFARGNGALEIRTGGP